eukprot:1663730-Amphidinium_carterae.1
MPVPVRWQARILVEVHTDVVAGSPLIWPKASKPVHQMQDLPCPSVLRCPAHSLTLGGVSPQEKRPRDVIRCGSTSTMWVEPDAMSPADVNDLAGQLYELVLCSSLEPLLCLPSPFPLLGCADFGLDC